MTFNSMFNDIHSCAKIIAGTYQIGESNDSAAACKNSCIRIGQKLFKGMTEWWIEVQKMMLNPPQSAASRTIPPILSIPIENSAR